MQRDAMREACRSLLVILSWLDGSLIYLQRPSSEISCGLLPAPFGPARIMIRRFLGIARHYSADLKAFLAKSFFRNLSISQLAVRLMLKGVEILVSR